MRYVVSLIAAASLASPALADEFTPQLEDFYRTEISKWAESSVIVQAIEHQNSRTSGYDQAQIDALDQTWRAEVGASQSPTITPVLSNGAADFLR